MGEWKPIRLAALGDIVTGKTPSKDNPEDWGDVMPFVTPSDYSSYGKYAGNSERKLSKSGIERLRKKVVPPGSILVTCIGSDMGKSVINRVPVITNQQINSISIANEEIDPDFIYYSMVGMEDELKNLGSSGSAVPLLNKGDFEQIEVNCPDLPAQRAIASVLSSLDAKIDLLHRQNKTLEGMAEALFRQWFVEYKAPGTKMAAGAALPDGWRVVALGDIADLNWGDTNATKKLYVEKGYTAYSAAGPDGFLPYYDYDRTGVVVSAIGSAGNTYLAMGKWSCIKNTIRFWATNPSVSTEYLYQATLGAENWPLRGTVQPFISQGDARAMEVVLPADDLAAQYGDIVRPMYIKIEANKEQITSLTKLRDTLLPKLMSGEVRVEGMAP